MKAYLLVALAIGALALQSAQAAITLVQSGTASNSVAATTLSITLGSTPTAGNIIVVAGASDTNSAASPFVSGTGIVWMANNTGGASSTSSLLAVGHVLSGASATITLTFGTSGGAAIAAAEYSGVSAWFDQSASSGASTSTAASGSTGTTSHANQLWVGALAGRFGTSASGGLWASPTNSFTIRGQAVSTTGTANDRMVALLERIVSSTGTANAGATMTVGTGTTVWAAQVLTLEAIPTAGAGVGASRVINHDD